MTWLNRFFDDFEQKKKPRNCWTKKKKDYKFAEAVVMIWS